MNKPKKRAWSFPFVYKCLECDRSHGRPVEGAMNCPHCGSLKVRRDKTARINKNTLARLAREKKGVVTPYRRRRT